MRYSVTGHYVQIWKDAYTDPNRIEYVVFGNTRYYPFTGRISRQEKHAGWKYVKDSLTKRSATKLAKDLRRVGFHSRVRIHTNDGEHTTVAEFKPKRSK